jgi:hypothetical protein
MHVLHSTTQLKGGHRRQALGVCTPPRLRCLKRSTLRVRFSGGQPPDAAATVIGGARNPLEQLRTTTDPLERAKLLRQLDDSWSAAVAAYVPTPVEEFLGEQLGIYSQTLILFAVQNPALAQFDLDTQVRPAIRSLKAAGLPTSEIFFLLSGAKRLDLLSNPGGEA